MCRRVCSIVTTALLLFSTFLFAGCGTSDPVINPALALPPALSDSTARFSEDRYAWTDYRYGYWQFDRGIGWAWVPGYVWSPTQVVWYTGFEYGENSPLPPPDLILPRPQEAHSAVQAGRATRARRVSGTFDQSNLKAILDRIETHRVLATARELLRADLFVDAPLSLFGEDRFPPPGPPPVPHFIFVTP